MVHTALPTDKYKCSKCNSSHVDVYELDNKWNIACLDCGFEEEYLE